MAKLLKIDAKSSRELRDLITTLAVIDKPIAAAARAQSRMVIQPEWQKGLREHSNTRMEVRAIAATGRAAVSDRNVLLEAGGIKGNFSGGFDPRQSIKAVEFGADRAAKKTYSRKSKNGGKHQVTRRTKAQFRLPRRGGYVAYPTAANLIPRIARLWIQTSVREIHEQLERISGK